MLEHLVVVHFHDLHFQVYIYIFIILHLPESGMPVSKQPLLKGELFKLTRK